MKTKSLRDATIITLIICLTSFVGIQAKGHEKGKFISPLPERAYALELDVRPSVVPLADETEQEANTRIIKKIWGKDWQIGVSIAKCESGLRSNAVNRHNTNGSVDAGLFQINSIHGWTEQELLDPIANAGIAYSKFVEQGTGPWYSSEHCWK